MECYTLCVALFGALDGCDWDGLAGHLPVLFWERLYSIIVNLFFKDKVSLCSPGCAKIAGEYQHIRLIGVLRIIKVGVLCQVLDTVQTFHGDLLQHMEKNTKLDMQFIKDSCQHYEIEYRHRAANLEKCMSELWRMERKRDKNAREMKESVNRLHAQMQAFVSESKRAAELEEKRRYRFLAEKHLLLSNTFLQFLGRARGMLQNRVLLWKEQSEASRSPSRAHSPGLLGPALGPPYPSGRLTPTRLDMPPRPLGEYGSPRSRHGSGSYGPEPSEARSASQLEPDRRSLPRTPSASSLYASNTQRSRSNSFGERLGGGGARRVRALVSHSEGANHTLLRFSAGDVVEVLVPEAQNGWLYGKLEGSSASGWFPEAYVKPLEEMPMNPMNPVAPMNSMAPMSPMNELPSSHSLDDLLDRPGNPAASSDYWDSQSRSRTPSRVPSRAPSPAPPPLPNRRSSVGSMGAATDVKGYQSLCHREAASHCHQRPLSTPHPLRRSSPLGPEVAQHTHPELFQPTAAAVDLRCQAPTQGTILTPLPQPRISLRLGLATWSRQKWVEAQSSWLFLGPKDSSRDPASCLPSSFCLCPDRKHPFSHLCPSCTPA
ncbi:brain-specific angiogenesis inhibitor 1-associated protein 2-like protein 2 isoform X2 [Rattus norvegicus]|uniref:brain-specific angiogenesis inhibitor 1-associated protein 2-like protein 2 isoform X2 n=1 Tax=Rattus norvegicus TaxID=10116 RepID=UPI0019173523|nr:brain-specific angiogenesis inhibitor 1-associated protein 2-like protein 2 isoform X2 [Rattus norvegicus]